MIEFRYDDEEDATSVVLTTHAVSLAAMVDVFERFVLAVGFGLPEGAHIGIEYDITECEGNSDWQQIDNSDPPLFDNGITNQPRSAGDES